MTASRRDLLLGAALLLFLALAVWAAAAVTSRTVNQLLHLDAAAEGEAWARYLAASVEDLEAISAGKSPSAESMTFFEQAQKVGNVFLYKIFDSNGGLRLASDKLEEAGRASEAIPVHNPEAAEVVLEGHTEVEVEEGTPPNRPAFYAEAYVPVSIDGRIIGIVEVYVDQSAKRAAFRARVASAAVALGGIIALAFGIPALGFYWRTRQKRAADTRAEFLADHDPLTRLLNRARFMRDLEQALSIGCPVAVHLVDIDRFKDINDTRGQAVGDEVLQQAARRMETLSERHDLLARIGGDEFAMAQIGNDPDDVEALSRRLVAALGETYHLKGEDVEATASVGAAIGPEHGEDAAGLVKSAETALSHTKGGVAAAYSLFRPEMDAELQARRELEGYIRRAVANDSFELYFQPIHSAAGLRLVGFESLLRLPRNGGAHISPTTFVPLAERMGLIPVIGEWVIRRACDVAASWPEHLTVAINLSPVQFEDGLIARKVGAALESSGLAAERLELEITEGLLLSDAEAIMRQLAELKALGVRIAMDDFGTGYSSLNYLWKFPFDKLKIDQSFVRALGGSGDNLTSVIRTIVALGRSLNMTITAEGVETEAQADFLRDIGCDQLQGFHLGRPMPVESLPARILQDYRLGIGLQPVAKVSPAARAASA
jgi:diguanylate cyclase (GGDEF)-like protein